MKDKDLERRIGEYIINCISLRSGLILLSLLIYLQKGEEEYNKIEPLFSGTCKNLEKIVNYLLNLLSPETREKVLAVLNEENEETQVGGEENEHNF